MEQTHQHAHAHRHTHSQTTSQTMVLYRKTSTSEVDSNNQPIYLHTLHSKTSWHRGTLPCQLNVSILHSPPSIMHALQHYPRGA